MAPTTILERQRTAVPVAISRRPEPPTGVTRIEFVNVEQTILSNNKCSCNAGDDNAY